MTGVKPGTHQPLPSCGDYYNTVYAGKTEGPGGGLDRLDRLLHRLIE